MTRSGVPHVCVHPTTPLVPRRHAPVVQTGSSTDTNARYHAIVTVCLCLLLLSTRRARAPTTPRRNISRQRSHVMSKQSKCAPVATRPLRRPHRGLGISLQTSVPVRGACVQCLRQKHLPRSWQHRVRPVDRSRLASPRHNEQRYGPKRTRRRCGTLSAPLVIISQPSQQKGDHLGAPAPSQSHKPQPWRCSLPMFSRLPIVCGS